MRKRKQRNAFTSETAKLAGQRSGQVRGGRAVNARGVGESKEQNERSRFTEEPSAIPNLDPETELRLLATDPKTAGYVRAQILRYLDAKERQKPSESPSSLPGFVPGRGVPVADILAVMLERGVRPEDLNQGVTIGDVEFKANWRPSPVVVGGRNREPAKRDSNGRKESKE